ncbi:MAG TPA: 3-hydroxyacyl-CoA dehydrogenase/enoyl-CoA hydratase family protein [Sulfolobales archaeon]|nr:3-hydroxyacyl-CoA dehydrogenase/enoyl-CoA hydratase family protein [Sulfolobales archaeon]
MRILVVGTGTIGRGVAALCAIAGFYVDLAAIPRETLGSVIAEIRQGLKKLGEKEASEIAVNVVNRVRIVESLAEACREADFVIETLDERAEVKRETLGMLDKSCKPDAVLLTITSIAPVSYIASAVRRLDRVVGLNFLGTPIRARFVEIVRGEGTSEHALRKTIEFVRSIGVEYIVVEKDVPGFVANRINLRILSEALRLLEEGYKPEEIDAVARHRIGMPLGPFEAIDTSGVDIIYNMMKEAVERGMDIEIPRIMEKMIEENRLGVKTGRGFYEYSESQDRAKISPRLAYRLNPLRIIAPGVNEAAWLLRNNVADRDSIDRAMVLGMAYPKGLLEMADDFGIDNILKALEGKNIDPLLSNMALEGRLGKKTGEGFYKWAYERREFGPVLYEKRHNYVLITMNRPEKLNALNEEMWRGLNQAFIQAERDPEVRVVIITGRGRAFSAGDDIAMMGSWKNPSEGREFFMKVVSPLLDTIINYEKPIISLVNGIAFGGGLEINLLFDIVIASEDAIFSVPEGLIGALPPIASSLGQALLGRKIIRYCLTGEHMDAEEAKQLGIVDIVVPKDQLEITGIEYVNKITRLAPLSVRAIKETSKAYKNIFKQTIEKGLHELAELAATEDFTEGMRSFLHRKRPSWIGR